MVIAHVSPARSCTGRLRATPRSLRLPLLLLTAMAASTIVEPARAQPTPPAEAESAAVAPTLFDGKSLEGWRIVDTFDFVDHGQVSVKDGVIYLERGKPATGISWKGEFPRSNYQLTLTAQRVEGNDFFCGLTFPVKDEYCTLILGGWGGSIVGLSNINGLSAVENATTQAIEFEQGRWYKVKLTITDDNITVMLDNKAIIDVETKDRKFTIYWEQEPVRPLGIVTWYTTGAIKDLKLVNLGGPAPAEESAPAQP